MPGDGSGRLQHVFITGSGRCGTSLVRNLIDGHSCIEVVPDEVTNLLGEMLSANGYSSLFTLSGPTLDALTHGLVRAYIDTVVEHDIARNFTKLASLNNDKEMSLCELLDDFVKKVLKSTKKIVLIDITDPNIKGLLENFPSAKILHMIRHPLNIINSEYRFRHADANSFGGGFPGSWEFSSSFERVNRSFLQACEFFDSPQVNIVKLEELQKHHEVVLKQIFDFIGVESEPINFHQTRYGENEVGVSTHTPRAKIFQQSDDWSCLTDNDLFYGSKIEASRHFYAVQNFAWQKNSYFRFLKRQLGFSGKNRKKTKSFKRLLKVVVVSIAQYFQDVRDKHYLQAKLEIPEFKDYPTL